MAWYEDAALGAAMGPLALPAYGIGGSVNPTKWFQGPEDDAAKQQADLIKTLQESAAGRGPSVADAQMQNALGRINAQSASLAASNPSMNPAAAQRLAMIARMKAGTQTAGMAAVARAQEQAQARAQLMDALNAYRQQQANQSKGKFDRVMGLIGSAASVGGMASGKGGGGAPAGGGGGTQAVMMPRQNPTIAQGGLMNPFTGQMEPYTGHGQMPDAEMPRRLY